MARSPVFTRHLQALASPADASADAEASRICAELRRLLRRELNRRGLFHLEPTHLGVFGWSHWLEAPRNTAPRAAKDALDELAADCYVYIFVDRLRSLQAQLRVKSDIEGIVLLNVRHFLFERQKRHDPIGYRVFEVLHAAVRSAIDRRWLFVLSGPASVRNATVLGTRDDVPPSGGSSVHLTSVVTAWSHDLLPDLLLNGGDSSIPRLAARLSPRFRSLPEVGITTFRFKDLVDPIKRGVRAGWASLFSDETGVARVERDEAGHPTVVRVVDADRALEDDDAFSKLAENVEAKIEASGRPVGSRRDLLSVWRHVCDHVSSDAETDQKGRMIEGQPARLPSHRQLSAALGIDRRRLPGLFSALRQFVRDTRDGLKEATPAAAVSPERSLGEKRRG